MSRLANICLRAESHAYEVNFFIDVNSGEICFSMFKFPICFDAFYVFHVAIARLLRTFKQIQTFELVFFSSFNNLRLTLEIKHDSNIMNINSNRYENFQSLLLMVLYHQYFQHYYRWYLYHFFFHLFIYLFFSIRTIERTPISPKPCGGSTVWLCDSTL